jgi:hypothetical protein
MKIKIKGKFYKASYSKKGKLIIELNSTKICKLFNSIILSYKGKLKEDAAITCFFKSKLTSGKLLGCWFIMNQNEDKVQVVYDIKKLNKI